MVPFFTQEIVDSWIAVAVDFRKDRFTRQPSPNTSPGPKMAMTACLPRGDATASFTLPCWI
jgi:hypothetical protein